MKDSRKSEIHIPLEALDCVQTLHELVPTIKILLSEDSAADSLLLRRELVRSGLSHEIHQVQSIAEIETLLKADKFDILISDYHIPGYSVESAFEKARSIDPEMPFLVISGLAKEEDVESLLAMGVNDFIAKSNPVRLVPSICREIVKSRGREHDDGSGKVLRGLEDRMFLHQSQEKLLHDIQQSSFNTTGLSCFLKASLEQIQTANWLPFGHAGQAFVVSAETGELELAAKVGVCSSLGKDDVVFDLHRRDELVGQLRFQTRDNSYDEEGSRHFIPRLLSTVCEGVNNKLAEQKLIHQATHHELTNLPNRRLLLQRADSLFVETSSDEDFARQVVVFVDIDNLKQTYDFLGSGISEALQVEIASRLHALVKPNDFVAHIDSDIFCLVLNLNERSAQKHKRGIDDLVSAIRGLTKDEIVIDGHYIFVTVSIGVAVREDNIEFEHLLQRAELALHAARVHGRNKMQLFEPALADEAKKRHEIEHDMRLAIERSEFELFYQPQVEPHTGRITSCEALIRWNHPEQGLVSPNDFIPIAEESGQIHVIGEWVLQTACRQAKTWLDSGLEDFSVSVNISAAQFLQPGFVDQVSDVLNGTSLPPTALELEITETVAMRLNHMSQIIATMTKLREIGVSLAIDDFGTGFSSLSYIQKFPIEKLKIDRAFVKDIGATDDGSLAKSIILLAQNLNLMTVVEGVETDTQKDFFIRNGGDFIQGFYYSKPLPSKAFFQLILDSASSSI